MSNGLSELPGALAAYATGVAAAVGRGAFYAAVFLVVYLGMGLSPLGMGLVLVLLCVALPAIGVAIVLEVPPRLKARFGSP